MLTLNEVSPFFLISKGSEEVVSAALRKEAVNLVEVLYQSAIVRLGIFRLPALKKKSGDEKI